MVDAATAAKREPIVTLHAITKDFAGVRALDEVTLDLYEGEVLALLGENGAGKSTLLRVLGGEHAPDGGQILDRGSAVRFATPSDAAESAGIHVIHQEPELVPQLSVAENLFLGRVAGRRRHLVQWRHLYDDAADLLERLGFARDLDPRQVVDTLLPAQRQLVEIVRALSGEVKVLALDEPTSSLTEDEVGRLFGIVARLRAQGVAIIYVSHRLHEILRLADRVAVLRDGRLVGIRNPRETTEDELVQLMVGRSVLGASLDRAPAGSDSVLRVEGLTTSWLHDVSFEVRRGEILGVAGLIGAGRTELGLALYGSVPITGGRVLVDGVEIHLHSPAEAMKVGISYTPEDRRLAGLVMTQNVRENVSLSVLRQLTKLRFVRPRSERNLVRALVDQMKIKSQSMESGVTVLSGGNQQKVVLARSLARRPKVLVLDEPTRGVDVGTKAEIYRHIWTLARAGLAVIFISSELPEVLEVSHRILVMELGRVTGIISATGASEEGVLRLAMQRQLGAPRVAADVVA